MVSSSVMCPRRPSLSVMYRDSGFRVEARVSGSQRGKRRSTLRIGSGEGGFGVMGWVAKACRSEGELMDCILLFLRI